MEKTTQWHAVPAKGALRCWLTAVRVLTLIRHMCAQPIAPKSVYQGAAATAQQVKACPADLPEIRVSCGNMAQFQVERTQILRERRKPARSGCRLTCKVIATSSATSVDRQVHDRADGNIHSCHQQQGDLDGTATAEDVCKQLLLGLKAAPPIQHVW